MVMCHGNITIKNEVSFIFGVKEILETTPMPHWPLMSLTLGLCIFYPLYPHPPCRPKMLNVAQATTNSDPPYTSLPDSNSPTQRHPLHYLHLLPPQTFITHIKQRGKVLYYSPLAVEVSFVLGWSTDWGIWGSCPNQYCPKPSARPLRRYRSVSARVPRTVANPLWENSIMRAVPLCWPPLLARVLLSVNKFTRDSSTYTVYSMPNQSLNCMVDSYIPRCHFSWFLTPWASGIESHYYKQAPHLIDSTTQDWKSPNFFSTKTEYIKTCFRRENDPSSQYGVKKHSKLTLTLLISKNLWFS